MEHPFTQSLIRNKTHTRKHMTETSKSINKLLINKSIKNVADKVDNDDENIDNYDDDESSSNHSENWSSDEMGNKEISVFDSDHSYGSQYHNIIYHM